MSTDEVKPFSVQWENWNKHLQTLKKKIDGLTYSTTLPDWKRFGWQILNKSSQRVYNACTGNHKDSIIRIPFAKKKSP